MDTVTALAVLENARDRCRTEDVRTPEVFAALKFLERTTPILIWPCGQFRRILEKVHREGWPAEPRWQILNAALEVIKRAVNQCSKCG